MCRYAIYERSVPTLIIMLLVWRKNHERRNRLAAVFPAMPVDSRQKRRLSRRDESDYRFDGVHAREVEQKRNRGEISCAECRRYEMSSSSPSVLLTIPPVSRSNATSKYLVSRARYVARLTTPVVCHRPTRGAPPYPRDGDVHPFAPTRVWKRDKERGQERFSRSALG